MKFFHLVFFCMMIVFAALQWNDVDANIWIAIYLAAAILALITYLEICLPCVISWAVIVAILAIYMLIGLAPGLSDLISKNAYSEVFFAMDDDKPYIEQARETLGLFIILTYCFSILIYQLKKHSQTTQ